MGPKFPGGPMRIVLVHLWMTNTTAAAAAATTTTTITATTSF